MHTLPIKTRILVPPQDNLFEAIQESSLAPQERDIVVVSSKVVAIHEGRCVKADKNIKEDLIHREADRYLVGADSRWPICLTHGTFLASAGIDESNCGNYFALLPEHPHQSAQRLRTFLMKEYGRTEIGVIVSDSHSIPLRYGTLGVALGWSGFEPVSHFTGKPDLFGRLAQFTRINVVDSLAGAGTFVMGELAEQTPLAVIRGAPHVVFTDRDTSRELAIPPREDIYWPLLKDFYERTERKTE